jgi:hypothetical protein
MKIDDDPFADLEKLRLHPEQYQAYTTKAGEKWATVPLKIQRRRQHFVKVPWTWVERLQDARYVATYRLALHVLYQHWKANGKPFKLANGEIKMGGTSRWQKWRALAELERLGLITVKKGGASRRGSPPCFRDWCTGAPYLVHICTHFCRIGAQTHIRYLVLSILSFLFL